MTRIAISVAEIGEASVRRIDKFSGARLKGWSDILAPKRSCRTGIAYNASKNAFGSAQVIDAIGLLTAFIFGGCL